MTLTISRDGGVLIMTLNRPKSLNAIDVALAEALRSALDGAEAENSVRVVILTGQGRAFCAGADLATLTMSSQSNTLQQYLMLLQSVCDRIESLPIPTIAAMNGMALGAGLELAMAADFRVASEGASMGLPEVLLGAIPGSGGTQRASRHFPPGVSRELVMLGQRLTAQRALELGFLHSVVRDQPPGSSTLEAALNLARELEKVPRASLSAAKRMLHIGSPGPAGTALAAERLEVAALLRTPEAAARISQVGSRRGPNK